MKGILVVLLVVGILLTAGCGGRAQNEQQTTSENQEVTQTTSPLQTEEMPSTPKASVLTSNSETEQNTQKQLEETETASATEYSQESKYPFFVIPNIDSKLILTPKENVVPTREEYAIIDSSYLEKNDWGDYIKSYSGGDCPIYKTDTILQGVVVHKAGGYISGSCGDTQSDFVDPPDTYTNQEFNPNKGINYYCRGVGIINYRISVCILVFGNILDAVSAYNKKAENVKTNENEPIDLGTTFGDESLAYRVKTWTMSEKYHMYFRRNNVVVHVALADYKQDSVGLLKYLTNIVDYKITNQIS